MDILQIRSKNILFKKQWITINGIPTIEDAKKIILDYDWRIINKKEAV